MQYDLDNYLLFKPSVVLYLHAYCVFFGVLAQVGPAGVLAWFGFYSLVFSPCRYLCLSLAHYSVLYHHKLVHFNLLWSGILSSSRFVHFSLIFPYWFSSISLVSTCLSATGFSKKVQNFLSLFISVFKRETSDLFHMRFSAREWKSGHSLSFFTTDFLISRPRLGWVCTLPIFFAQHQNVVFSQSRCARLCAI